MEQNSAPPATTAEWLQQIRQVQSSRISPEVKARVEAQRARHRAHHLTPQRQALAARSARIEKCCKMSKASWVGSMKSTLSPSPQDPQDPQDGSMSATMPRRQQQMQVDQASLSASLACQSSISHIMSSPALASSAGALTMSDAAFEETSRQIMQAANVDEGDADVSEDELAQLLGQLLNEPDNDEERAAKFALYEKYSETVSNARKATLDFWAEAVAEFEGGAKTKVEDDIENRSRE